MFSRAQIILVAAVIASLLVSLASARIDPYFLHVTLGVGINIILAVSLNLINGYTGQFSLGHAGFMAVGAYSAGVVTTNYGSALLPLVGGQTWILFPLALACGGLMAAAAGLCVGVPSLRLKGDYLAIVTLGFGEIIKVILQNVDSVGGARGMIGIPAYTNIFWTFSIAALTVYVVWGLVHSTFGRGFIAVNDDEVAAEAMGINPTKALEYMATGRNIVSSAVPDVVRNFGSVVKIANSHDEFIKLCREVAERPDRDAIERGIQMAQANTWESIVQKLENHMAGAIGQKSVTAPG